MHRVKRAILLLAGRGRRMGGLTEEQPKCLLKVARQSILERALLALSQVGIAEAVLVVGYRAEQIRDSIGDHYGGLDLAYVLNEQYAETNTAYSLWLARQFLDRECLLLEGDILFEIQVLRRILDNHAGGSAWAAVPVNPSNAEGVLLSQDARGCVSRAELVRNPTDRSPDLTHKCGGIQLLDQRLAQLLAARLQEVIHAGQRGIFADLVLGAVLEEAVIPMALCSLAGLRWSEVDDVQDLEFSRQLFRSIHRAHTFTVPGFLEGEGKT